MDKRKPTLFQRGVQMAGDVLSDCNRFVAKHICTLVLATSALLGSCASYFYQELSADNEELKTGQQGMSEDVQDVAGEVADIKTSLAVIEYQLKARSQQVARE